MDLRLISFNPHWRNASEIGASPKERIKRLDQYRERIRPGIAPDWPRAGRWRSRARIRSRHLRSAEPGKAEPFAHRHRSPACCNRGRGNRAFRHGHAGAVSSQATPQNWLAAYLLGAGTACLGHCHRTGPDQSRHQARSANEHPGCRYRAAGTFFRLADDVAAGIGASAPRSP